MKGMFMTELEILEHEDLGPWFMEIKKKAFLEGAASVLFDLAEIPQEIREKNSKVVKVEKIADWAEKKIETINRELNQLMAFELTYILAQNLPWVKAK